MLVLQLMEYPSEKAVGEAQQESCASPTALPTALFATGEDCGDSEVSSRGAHLAEFQCE